ncbi:uncharacterized protein Dwil_GK11058 [Drosophila willistoni]|uniref:Arrestin C-terminal-like domain-containing protein n=1 Tax=Drosophila willistoni TaxID=7260 RepID=B4N8B8_DROWI|nr:arrestin domain-containing protein 3 [Drosophila willistoni]EDW81369.1 uncharacterized protein Dwil_GK11058 [Drosophila willistoni]
MNITCDMQLDRPNGVYEAGQTINGHIYLTLPERALIKAILMEANGFAATAWLKPHNEKKQKESPAQKPQAQKPPLTFEHRVDYFAKMDYFVGSDVSLPQIMEAGTYNYGFTVQLPKNCPSSFEGSHGHIRYIIKVLIHSSADRGVDVAHTRQLKVFQHSCLNHESVGTCEMQRIERTPCLKFWQKPLLLQLEIPRRGYAPGAGISVHVKLNNPQRLQLTEVIYKLNMIVTYVGLLRDKPKRSDLKIDRQNILTSSHQLTNLPREELIFFQHLHMLQVPQTAASLNTSNCACIQIGYEVEVTVKTYQANRSILAQIPVIIGNVLPACIKDNLIEPRSLEQPEGSAPELTPAPETTLMTAPNFSQSMTSLVSNFREAEFMTATNLNKTNKHALSGDQLDFRPRYLYYQMDGAQLTDPETTLKTE